MSAIYSPSLSSFGVTYVWVQGDTINDTVTISSPAITAQLYTFWFTIKQNLINPILDAYALFQTSWTAMGTSGSVSTAIQASRALTLGLPPGSWAFDWVMIDASGNDTTLMTSAGQPNNWGVGNAGAMIIIPRSTSSH